MTLRGHRVGVSLAGTFHHINITGFEKPSGPATLKMESSAAQVSNA